jgi:hypothetical protein
MLAAIASLAVCCLCGASGAVFRLTIWRLLFALAAAADWVAFVDFFMVLSPFLNGCAVFANKHALAMAHAIEGGKRNGEGNRPPGTEWKASESEGLHKRSAEDWGDSLRAPGAALLSRFVFHAWRGAQEMLLGSALRAGTGPPGRVAEDAHLRPQTGRPPPRKERTLYGRPTRTLQNGPEP